MEDKKAWTKAVSDLLQLDDRAYVKKCEYHKNDWNEIVTITFKDGDKVDINVSCNSQGAILHEIIREVYGEGAFGRIERW